MIKKVIAGFLTFGFAFNVWADVNVESIRYEDSAVVGQTTLQLNGAGLRKKVFFKVYAAGLYVPQKAQTAKGVLEQNGAARVRLGCVTFLPKALSRLWKKVCRTTPMRQPAKKSHRNFPSSSMR